MKPMAQRDYTLDPDTLAAIVAHTMNRLTCESGETLGMLGETAPSLTDTLTNVLLEQTAMALSLRPSVAEKLNAGLVALAAYTGFEFALRCAAAVIPAPLADHRPAFRRAARESVGMLVECIERGVHAGELARAERPSGGLGNVRAIRDT